MADFRATLSRVAEAQAVLERLFNDPDPAARLEPRDIELAVQLVKRATELVTLVQENTAYNLEEFLDRPDIESTIRHTIQDACVL